MPIELPCFLLYAMGVLLFGINGIVEAERAQAGQAKRWQVTVLISWLAWPLTVVVVAISIACTLLNQDVRRRL